MQRVASVDQHAVEHRLLLCDLREEQGIAIDVTRLGSLWPHEFAPQRPDIGFVARLVDEFEASLAVTVEGRAAEVWS